MKECESCPIHCPEGKNPYNEDCEHWIFPPKKEEIQKLQEKQQDEFMAISHRYREE